MMEPESVHSTISMRARLLLLLVAGCVVLADQLSKLVIEIFLPLYRSWTPLPHLLPTFRFSHVSNTGSAFGLFAHNSAVFAWVATLVSLAIVIYNFHLSGRQYWLRLALGLQLGGAVGNLVDRLRLGHVTDFIDFGPWVFNLADVAIILGAIVLAGVMWQESKQHVPAPFEEMGKETS
ncbi:MAG: signal peptidase II [Ardenticatenaceae bacterium]|nr:signal peptidase II [Ardenticatenaceae bacterium]